MKLSLLRPLLLAALLLTAASASAAASKIKVLIIDGQNNHQWATTTPLLRSLLEDSGLFTVDVSTTPPKPNAPRLAKDSTPAQKTAQAEALQAFRLAEPARIAAAPALWAKWRPRFNDYAVVISNYNGESWPEEVRTAFVAYVKNGGGFVSYHAADNAFSEWPEYNDMIGLGGWGDRNEKSGPYIRLRDGAWAPLATPGPGGGHGPQREFLVTTATTDHPITRGLPATWMHSKDELYQHLRGPAKNFTVLGSAVSDITHEAEPLLLALSYGSGRVFHTALGHYVEALDGLGFQVTFLRGTEWAATGRVTQPAPTAAAFTAASPAAVRPLKLN